MVRIGPMFVFRFSLANNTFIISIPTTVFPVPGGPSINAISRVKANINAFAKV